MFQFLWDNKPEKKSRERIFQDYCHGGLKMVDIDKFIQSLKCSQVKDMGDRQAVIENEVRSIKTKVDDIEFSAGVMEADTAGLFLNDERKNDTINSMLDPMNNMDREMRRNNLRIFGIADIPDESTDETKAKVISDVLNKAFDIDD